MRSRWLGVTPVLAIASLLLAAGTVAQQPAARDPSGHRLVGTWVIDTNVDSEADVPGLLTVHGDGTLQLFDCCFPDSAGVWEPRTARTAAATLMSNWFDEEGLVGFSTVRATVRVNQAGDAFTATFTQEIPLRDGGTTGQLGPVTAVARRVAVEPMGSPVAPLPVPEPPAPSASPSGVPVASASPTP